MPGYIVKAVAKYQHPSPTKPQHAPHKWNKPVYGLKTQLAKPHDISQKLDKKGKTTLQSITGTFLYYARAVESPILVALNNIGTQQANPTVNNMAEAK